MAIGNIEWRIDKIVIPVNTYGRCVKVNSSWIDIKNGNRVLGNLRKEFLCAGIVEFVQYAPHIVVTKKFRFHIMAQNQFGVLFAEKLFKPV